MECPKCHSRMRVTHTYQAGLAGKTQRLECDCGLSATAVTVVFAVDPRTGSGAKAVADQIQKTPPSLVFAAEDGADKSEATT